jgi:predicted acyl esterase
MKHYSEIRNGMRIDWNVPITMDDGLVLRADVFCPTSDGRYPVILSYGPYAKGRAFQDGYPNQWQLMTAKHPDVAEGSTNCSQSWKVVDPEKWVPDGYACVRVDSRGCGGSPGFIDHFSPRETKDFYDCIEWAGTEPWSNGKVGLNGISYYAINQWHVASLQPPSLAPTVHGKDYEYQGPSGGRLANFKNELRGCGPFLHDDPRDRPPEVFSGKTTLHTGPERASYLLLPVLPG